jgi:hypothetical protein
MYCAADVVAFGQPSISIQQALATGASVVIPDDPCLTHLYGLGQVQRFRYGSLRSCRRAFRHAFEAHDPAGREFRAIRTSAQLSYSRLLTDVAPAALRSETQAAEP